MEKRQFLDVRFEKFFGLQLRWNFNDIFQKDKYFRHLFIIHTFEKELVLQSLQQYFKQMKCGDFLSCFYFREDESIYQKRWVEKTLVSRFINSTSLSDLNKSKKAKKHHLLKRVCEEMVNYKEPIILNFIVEDTSQKQYFEKEIQRLRSDGFFDYIATFFGPTLKNSISVSAGLNQFFLNSQNVKEILHLYLIFVNQAALHNASIEIECLNGQLSTLSAKDWRNQNFSTIVREYFGPSAHYLEDVIEFSRNERQEIVQYHLVIRLKFKLFSGKIYKSEKTFLISYIENRSYPLSMKINLEPSEYVWLQKIILTSNPFSTKSLVKFQKQITSQDEQNLEEDNL